MAKAKKKLLPKDFEVLLKQGDLESLKAVFETCEVDARGGVFGQTALAFNDCPDQLARWLVINGADLSAGDGYGDTPLHSRARHWQGRIEILLELGADIHHGENLRGTPLHSAAGSYIVNTARVLIDHGARVDALNSEKQTPMAYALQRCNNTDIVAMAQLADLFLRSSERVPTKKKSFVRSLFGSGKTQEIKTTPELKAFVTRIGTNFEFHRSNFNSEHLAATSAALDRLYILFDVSPVPHRAMHDRKSPIIAKSVRWQDRHQELWELLVPSSGASETVQGEVVRISGKIRNELEGNGGINWDVGFRKMADAFLLHISSGISLPPTEVVQARALVAEVKKKRGDTGRLCELAVNWVALNPKPAKLPPPDYAR